MASFSLRAKPRGARRQTQCGPRTGLRTRCRHLGGTQGLKTLYRQPDGLKVSADDAVEDSPPARKRRAEGQFTSRLHGGPPSVQHAATGSSRLSIVPTRFEQHGACTCYLVFRSKLLHKVAGSTRDQERLSERSVRTVAVIFRAA